MRKIKIIFLLIILSILVVACSSNDENNQDGDVKEQDNLDEQEKEEEPQTEIENTKTNEDEEQVENKIQKVPELPKTMEQLINYPVGEFGSEELYTINDEVREVLNEIPILGETATEEEISQMTNYLYSLFKTSYEDPKEAIENSTLQDPEIGEQLTATEQYNVEIVLDSSGSMANYMGQKTRMDLAKESIKEFASTLPEKVHLSLRVYGHKGTGSDSDKKMSCEANELVYTSDSYNEKELTTSLNSFEPAGWTPLDQAIQQANKDLSEFKGEQFKNIIYIVSDGIETCDGDPIKAAKDLIDSGISPVVNIIGFDLANKDEQQLKDIASAANGNYLNIRNQNQLDNELEKTLKETTKWVEWKNNERNNAYDQTYQERANLAENYTGWNSQLSRDKNIVVEAIYELNRAEKLSDHQKEKMIKDMEEFYSNHKALSTELYETLKEISKENLTETLDEIDKLYDKNVSN